MGRANATAWDGSGLLWQDDKYLHHFFLPDQSSSATFVPVDINDGALES